MCVLDSSVYISSAHHLNVCMGDHVFSAIPTLSTTLL